MTEAYNNPLQTIIDEFKNISPETTNAFIFKNTGEVAANTKPTTPDQTTKLISNFQGIANQAQVIGGIESLTIQAASSQLNITAMNNFYLVTVSSRAADQVVTKSLTSVIVPTVVWLASQVASKATENQPSLITEPQEEVQETVLPAEEKPTIKSIPEPQSIFEAPSPKTPVNQFMVEKIGGLLVSTDTVRIDPEIVAQWSELCDGKQFAAVNIEGLDGKKTTCKLKPIKDSKSNIKGIIQIPEKILQTLKTEKGKLVIVRPVVE